MFLIISTHIWALINYTIPADFFGFGGIVVGTTTVVAINKANIDRFPNILLKS